AAVFGNARERLDLRERVSQCAHDVPSGGCGGFSHMCRFASSTRALDTGFEGAMREPSPARSTRVCRASDAGDDGAAL
ncbi:hypothetical protein K6L09_44825, partial [Burkholderia cepacia]